MIRNGSDMPIAEAQSALAHRMKRKVISSNDLCDFP